MGPISSQGCIDPSQALGVGQKGATKLNSGKDEKAFSEVYSYFIHHLTSITKTLLSPSARACAR